MTKKRLVKRLLIGCGVMLMMPVVGICVLLFLLFDRTEGQYLDVDGVRIHYTVEGQGETVVLVHGLAAQRR